MEWDRPRSSEIPGREDRKGGQGGALKELQRHLRGTRGHATSSGTWGAGWPGGGEQKTAARPADIGGELFPIKVFYSNKCYVNSLKN